MDSYLQDILTVPASLSGLPAASVPMGVIEDGGEKWPMGVDVMGQWGMEGLVLEVGKWVEKITRGEVP